MVRVYIHGRPQGQDIWCKSPVIDDEFYLNPFLDSKIGEDMNAVLQVDMWHQNAYYSYIHRRNVVEKGNRPNAYFAITVCFEKQYCTHVATLYELLDTIYKQLCLNNIIEKSGDQEHFLVAQFQEKESVLVQITNVIQQNIEKYISNGLETIESKQDTISTQIKSYSTVDVDSPQFITDCLAHRILVSPSIMTKDRLPQELQQKIVAIEAQKAEALKEKNHWQSDAEHLREENTALTRKQKELQEQITELQKQIESIKDDVRSEYKEQINTLQNSKEKLQKQNDNLQCKLNKLLHGDPHSRDYPDNPQGEDFTYIQEQLHKIKTDIRRMAGRFRYSNTAITLVAALFNTALLITIVVLSCIGMPKSHNTDNGETSSLTKDIVSVKESVFPVETLPDYSNAKIDIPNLNTQNFEIGKPYILTLKGGANQDYKWRVEGDDTVLEGNMVVVNKAGEITISCIDSHNYIVKQRKITAQ